MMKYCTYCGYELTYGIPEGDNRERFICTKCSSIHYENPRIIAGSLPVWEDSILLCRRAIEPRYGLWTLPAGFMENHETTMEAANRETMEEAGATILNPELYCIYNIPHISQVYMIYKGTLKDGASSAGAESLETRLFKLEEIPWDLLAFRVIKEVLYQFASDTSSGHYQLHSGDIIRNEDMTYTITHNS